MRNQAPFSLRIFVADGDPDGLRLVERSNWMGKAIMFPRALYTQVRSRSEFQQAGVYLLLGPRENSDGDMLYIGEGDPIRPRFENHYREKDFWTRSVFFVAGPAQLNKAHVQFLEAKLISLAIAAKRMPLENLNRPTEPTLSEADRAEMEVFLENILGMLPVLGVPAFEHIHGPIKGEKLILTCRGRGVMATGLDTPQGFVIQAGSHAAGNEVPSLKEWCSNISELRSELKKNGVLKLEGNQLRFTQNYTFNSPSFASSLVLGRSSNGRADWKDPGGRTLKQIQEAQTEK